MATQATTRFTTGHVGLNVSDLERSKRFYQSVFGFELAGESKDGERAYAFLAQRGTVVLTLWKQSDGTFATERPGLHHLSFQVGSVEDVRAAERRLRDVGGRILHGGVVPHVEGSDSGGLFFEDPDGIRLEISVAAGAGGSPAPYGEAPTCGFF
jgi:lactoylglutathione lyase